MAGPGPSKGVDGPTRRMITKNQKTCLAVRAVLDNGEDSAPE
jgi:hypothetical protein